KIELASRRATTFLGTGKAGTGLSPAQLSEPGGLSATRDKLFIADTNNHRVLVASLKSGEETDLKIDGLQPPPPPSQEGLAGSDGKGVIDVAPQSVSGGEALTFEIGFKLPDGYKLNKLAKVTYKLEAAGEQSLIAAAQLKTRKAAEVKDGLALIGVPLAKKDGEAKLTLALSFSYCRDGVGGLCKLKTVRWSVPVTVLAEGKSSAIKLEAVAE
ncbi:MAG TPA: hypothetical protein VK137_19020, partial [Planctomycetaceae bacterium]|nr:hypothetical protein [Planctomycetaceae bacterium]